MENGLFFSFLLTQRSYLHYYGLALMTRDPCVALIGLIAHVSQMIFLYVIETPRMFLPSASESVLISLQT